MSQSLSGRTSTMIIASLVSLVMCVVMWRMTQSSLQRPFHPTKKSVPLLSSLDESLTRDMGNTTTQHTALPTELTVLPTEVYDKSLQWLSTPEYDTMPFSEYLKKREVLLKAEWISALFLHHSLHDYLKARTLPLTCITVTPDSLFILHPRSESGQWEVGLMVRFPVLRLINYWGYDVAAYDCDAVLLHNPQVVYSERQQVDVFSSSGTFPHDVSQVWGFMLCAGTRAVGLFTVKCMVGLF